MRLNLRPAVIAGLVVTAALIASGCGGGGDDHATTSAAQDQRSSASTDQPAYLGPNGRAHGWMRSRLRPKSIVWAVGDAAVGRPEAEGVAGMVLNHRVDRLLYLGDVYETGTAREFETNYRPLYGRVGNVTAPTIGNHEWPNIATGYVPYWTAVRGTPPPLWYAFAASGWQLISLNSNVPTSADQENWVHSLIEDTPDYGNCRIAFMHHPRYSAGPHGDLAALQGIFDELEGHASIALAGHDHDMERLRPVDGITQYVAGAGGSELYPVNRGDPRLAFFDDTDHGALRIRLQPGNAALSFVDEDGTNLDRSTVSCQQG
jgi:Calcineurin-like phosphoesterase